MSDDAKDLTESEGPTLEEKIQAANLEIMGDIAHHADWLEKQQPGLGRLFMQHLAGLAQLTLVEMGGEG